MSDIKFELESVGGFRDLPQDPDQMVLVPWGAVFALARRCKDPTRFVAIVPMIWTWALITGGVDNWATYDDRFCYDPERPAIVVAALAKWEGEGDAPDGWHRHPASGRRRENGDPTRESVDK